MVEVFDGEEGAAKFLLFADSDCIIQAAEQAHGTAVNSHLLVPCHSAENLIFPVHHLICNTSSPSSLKLENEDSLPQLLLSAGDQGRWAAREYMQGQKIKTKPNLLD